MEALIRLAPLLRPMTSLVPVAFAAVPGLVAVALLVAVRRHLRSTLSPRAATAVAASWAAGALALLAGPAVTLYTFWTSVGRLDAPAPGLEGFAVARWLLTLGGVGFLVGVGVYVADRRDVVPR
jgi:hypothetical protein